jgi:transposase
VTSLPTPLSPTKLRLTACGLREACVSFRPRLSAEQRAEIAQLVEIGPDRAVHGVVRWRRIDLKRVIIERFGIAYHERTVGKLLEALGFSHVSARPCHPAQDAGTIEAFKAPRHAETPKPAISSLRVFIALFP